jgi:Ca2+-binding RTX toxin-like protein
LIYGGAGNNIIYGGAGNDTFAWDHAGIRGTYDHIMDFSEGDKLRFSDLLDTRTETLDDFLRANVSMDPDRQNFDDRTLLITIRDGELSKDVEITFDQSNTAFDQFMNTYNDAADEDARAAALRNFLYSISEG